MRAIDLSNATWRKSSYSNSDGGQCIEVSHDFLTTTPWRKSSYSNPDGGACIEVSHDFLTTAPLVPVRDSKNPTGPALILPAAAWQAFVTAVRHDELHAA